MSAHVRARDFPTARSIRDAGCYGRLASILGCARLNPKCRSGRRGSELELWVPQGSQGLLEVGRCCLPTVFAGLPTVFARSPCCSDPNKTQHVGVRFGSVEALALQRKRKRGAVWHHGWPPHSPRAGARIMRLFFGAHQCGFKTKISAAGTTKGPSWWLPIGP